MTCQNCNQEYDLDFFGMNQELCDECERKTWREENVEYLDIKPEPITIGIYEGPELLVDATAWGLTPVKGEAVELGDKTYRVRDVRYRHFPGRGQGVRIEVSEIEEEI